MKPAQAKILTAPGKREETKWDGKALVGSGVFKDDYLANSLNQAIERTWYAKKIFHWQSLRIVIEGIESLGFKVSITKDGKEYNK